MIQTAEAGEQEEAEFRRADQADEQDYPVDGQDFHTGKIYCAICIH
jgi:hypothetical protein